MSKAAEQKAIVVHGGDGAMLHAMKEKGDQGLPFYGVHYNKPNSVGFLMNAPLLAGQSIEKRIQSAQSTAVHPLKFHWQGKTHLAINEVSLIRASPQAVRLSVFLNNQKVLDGLYGDGLIISTPMGSTAYNRAAGGMIIPIEAPLLALTPVCPITPWRGALINQKDVIRVSLNEGSKRPVDVCADGQKIGTWQDQDVVIQYDPHTEYRLLFDPEHHLEARIRATQFNCHLSKE